MLVHPNVLITNKYIKKYARRGMLCSQLVGVLEAAYEMDSGSMTETSSGYLRDVDMLSYLLAKFKKTLISRASKLCADTLRLMQQVANGVELGCIAYNIYLHAILQDGCADMVYRLNHDNTFGGWNLLKKNWPPFFCFHPRLLPL